MAREIEQTELDQQIGQDLERVDWWVGTVKSLAEPIPGYDGLHGEPPARVKPASA